MDMLPWVLFGLAVLGAVFFAVQWNAVRQIKAPSSPPPADLEKKLADARAEIAAAKEETQRKQKQLEEARDEAKKKLARAGRKAEREEEAAKGPDPRDVEIAGLKKGLSSLESQLNAAKRDVDKAQSDLDRVRADAKADVEGAAKGRDVERSRTSTLSEENAALKKTLEELRMSKKKEAERPEIPGTSLDLKSLPPEAVQELARYFRKGEEFERLYAVAQGQLQLAQDRFLELQRRYFAVCRELALAAGAQPQSDEEAKKLAEGAVAGSDQAARNGAQQGAQAAQPGAPGAPGEGGGKKRRRRRRRRNPGAPGEAGAAQPGAEGASAEAAAGEEGHDEGEEGPDGDDGNDGDEPATENSGGGETGSPAPV
jgi:hypothetical protein